MRSVQSMKKITRAFELIAASRMVKAQQRVEASGPYTELLTRAVSAVATYSHENHLLTTEKSEIRRSAVLLVTADRGLAGAYSANVIKEGDRLVELLRDRGRETVVYVTGRKAAAFYRFRQRPVEREWTGFSDSPTFEVARDIAGVLIDAFRAGGDNGGVDEIHVVYTEYVNMVTQVPEVVRLLPLKVVQDVEEPAPDKVLPLYEFEPSTQVVLDALLPAYVESKIYSVLLESAASELAARQRAMKSATDNAEELIRRYTRLANTARQAEITQEISEIVGGANALSDAAARS
jgi:F-type H+-transporting ATPase subunit gamma